MIRTLDNGDLVRAEADTTRSRRQQQQRRISAGRHANLGGSAPGLGIRFGPKKLKSFFTLLGVIVGVMCLIVVLSIVQGMDSYIRDTLTNEVFGVNTVTGAETPAVTVDPSREQRRAWARAPRIRDDDLELLRERVTYPALIGAESDASGELASEDGLKVENVRIIGASAEMFEIRNWTPERGRIFTRQEADQGVPVVVLGTFSCRDSVRAD